MLIKVPHAEKRGKNRSFFSLPLGLHAHQKKYSNPPLPPPAPFHLLIVPSSRPSLILSIRPLCVLQSLQQSAHLENPQLPSSISSTHTAHTHTRTQIKKKIKSCSIKVLLKPENHTSFPSVYCLKELVIALKRVSLCSEQKVFQCFLSKCLKLFMLSMCVQICRLDLGDK